MRIELIVAVLIASCAVASAADERVTFHDDFDSFNGGAWPVQSGGHWKAADGWLHFAEDWSVIAGGRQLADAAVEAEVVLNKPAANKWHGIGLLARYDGRNAYLFRLIHAQTQRHLSIGKLIGMNTKMSRGKPFDPAPGKPLRLKGVVRGKRLQFYVNGKLEMELIDPDPLPAGRVGILSQMDAKANWIRQLDLTPQQIRSNRAAEAPQIDGRLDDHCWAQATQATGFVRRGSPDLAKAQTIVRLCQDDRALYVAFECLGQEPAQLHAAETKHDGNIWADDIVEVFVDTDRDRQTYYHFSVNAGGTRFEEKGLSSDWDGQWQANCHAAADRWVAEIAIPFASLSIHPGVGDMWGLHLARKEQSTEEYSVLWQTGLSFHRPDLWGDLTGLDADFARYCYGVEMKADPSVVGDNLIHGRIENQTPQDCSVRLQLQVRDDHGREVAVPKSAVLAIAAGGHVEHDFGYMLSGPGSYRWRVLVSEASTGEPVHTSGWQSIRTVPPVQVELVSSRYRTAFYQTRNKEPFATDIAINVGAEHLVGTSLAVALVPVAGGPPIASQTITPVRRGVHHCTLGKLKPAPGDYQLRATLLDRSGKALGRGETPLRVLPSSPNTVRIRDDGTVMVRGKPFFPLAVWAVTPDGIERVSRAGFNTIHWYGFTYLPLERRREYLDTAHANGMMVTYSIKKFTTKIGVRPKSFRRDSLSDYEVAGISEHVMGCKDHPALLNWYIADEPTNFVEPSKVQQAAELVERLDPYHPHAVAFCKRYAVSVYAPIVDVIMPDMYPFDRLPLATVGKAASDAIERTGGKQSVWMITQASQQVKQYLDGRRARPEYLEIRCMAWHALVAGVHGLYFYDYRGFQVPEDERHLLHRDLFRVGGEISKLIPVLLADRTHKGFDVQVQSGSVQWTTRSTDQATYVFAVNPSAQTGTVRIAWPSPTAPSLLTDAFTGETHQADKGGFTVEMGAYEVCGYRLSW